MSGRSEVGKRIAGAAALAVEKVNTDKSLFPGFQLEKSSTDQACTVRISYFNSPDPSKLAMAYKIVDAVTGCKVEWLQIASGMLGLQMIKNGSLDIGCLGSLPTVIGLMPPHSLDYEVISLQLEVWDSEALIVRPNIHNPQDLHGKTLACPASSTSHYQLLYLIDQLKLRDVVTIWTAQPSELEDLWRTGVIDGAFVWSPHVDRLRAAFKTRTLVTGSAVARLGAPTFVAYACLPGLRPFWFWACNDINLPRYVLRRNSLKFEVVRDVLRALIACNFDFHQKRWATDSPKFAAISHLLELLIEATVRGIYAMRIPTVQELQDDWFNDPISNGDLAKSILDTAHFVEKFNGGVIPGNCRLFCGFESLLL